MYFPRGQVVKAKTPTRQVTGATGSLTSSVAGTTGALAGSVTSITKGLTEQLGQKTQVASEVCHFTTIILIIQFGKWC